MKRSLLYIATFLLVGFASCDVIDENSRYIEVESDDTPTEKVQRVLIEEFTGRLCNNCPEGAAVIHDIQGFYQGQIIPVAIHAGQLAPPAAGPYADQDFQTEAGDAYEKYFGSPLKPAAMINRYPFDASVASTNRDKWLTYVISEVAKTPVCEVIPVCEYDETTRTATISTEVWAYDGMPADPMYQVYILEDSIVSPQLTKTGMVTDYVHNHILRAAVNGTWGEKIKSMPAGEHESYKTSIVLDEKWVAENCQVVAYVYDNADRHVLQVNVCPVIKKNIEE